MDSTDHETAWERLHPPEMTVREYPSPGGIANDQDVHGSTQGLLRGTRPQRGLTTSTSVVH
eukprot:1774297-Pleurochrysis_carterae.AAC.1